MLKSWLEHHDLNDENLAALASQPFAATALRADEAKQATAELWTTRKKLLKQTPQAELDYREIVIDDLRCHA